MKKLFQIYLVLLFSFHSAGAQRLSGYNVLLYTKNGKGYVHENIPFAKQCFDSLSRKKGFILTSSEDPSIFSIQALKNFDLIVFASTNNEVFDTNEQRLAFRQFMEAGGQFLGIHSVLGTERNWTWFKQMLGGSFAWHPRFQPYHIINIRPDHASVKQLPLNWVRQDECYFMKELFPGPHTLMVADIHSLAVDTADSKRIALNKGTFGRYYPAVWEHFYDGGLAWITALGHASSDYSSPEFTSHLLQALVYLKSKKKKLDFSKAYATNYDEEVRYEGAKKIQE